MFEKRPYYQRFLHDIPFRHGKMAFIAGPRQVGKTTFAEHLLQEMRGKYYTWDDVEFKRQWIKDPKLLIPEAIGTKQLVVFDELHKAPRWKSSLKGVYDLRHNYAHIVVTGSARLDVFRRGGDSLLGRYFLLRMHPFSLGELTEQVLLPDELQGKLTQVHAPQTAVCDRLFAFGGFPDPYLKADRAFWNLWRRMRLERIIREDLLTLSQTSELSLIESYATFLSEKVGSPFSLQSLAEDVAISHPTARRWLNWLSQLFYVYTIAPYTLKRTRSLRKQPKLYLWDWSEVAEPAARFENMVAGHLLKACHYWTDCGIGTFELFYLRDKEKREVDFLIVRDRKPWLLAECKLGDTEPSPHLIAFAKWLQPSLVVQVVKESGVHEKITLSPHEKGYLISADRFLRWF